MKRILVLAVCAILLICAFCIPTFATAETDVPAVEETTAVEEPTITESIVDYVKNNKEEITIVLTIILTAFYEARCRRLMNDSIGVLNKNSIAVAASGNESAKNASDTMSGYKEKMEELLSEFRKNAEEKEKLEGLLTNATKLMETAKLANVELAAEVAELLVLANIPNAKKEELYARHIAAVNAIADAEKTEVNTHDGEEA